MSYLLGIDVGTSTIKTVLVDRKTNGVNAQSFLPLSSKHVEVEGVPGACERRVQDLLETLERCMSELDSSGLLNSVQAIGVCGQMHGCVLWKDSFQVLDCLPGENFTLCSNLITWQDSRCTSEFLSSLPRTQGSNPISTGYGCATLAWLQQHQPESLQPFARVGTIMDLIVWGLCNRTTSESGSNCKKQTELEDCQVIMSSQNATSWGYYDPNTREWEIDILKTIDFPVLLLPKIVDVPSRAGTLSSCWHGISQGTPVGVAMGDLQCSIFATNPSPTDAILNIGSASQIAIITRSRSEMKELVHLPASIMQVPYFGGDFLLVSASLTGANAMSTLVGMLKSWMDDLGIGNSTLPESELYDKLLDLAKDKLDTSLRVGVTLWGERYSPEVAGNVSNVRTGNLSLGDVASATWRGIIENLHAMLSEEILRCFAITRLLGSGSVLQKNPILCHHAENVFGCPLEVRKEADSPTGAALAMKTLI